jgi:hypothetical protein
MRPLLLELLDQRYRLVCLTLALLDPARQVPQPGRLHQLQAVLALVLLEVLLE